jgi:hypothetical protein
MMEQLSLRFLGPPEVRYQGQPLKFRSRKELALLIYLVIEGGHHSREKLIAFLWPDSDREHGQASLRNTLARLRQNLAGAGSYLIIEPGAVSFNFGRPFELDLNTVQTALHALQETTQTARLGTCAPYKRPRRFIEGIFWKAFPWPTPPNLTTGPACKEKYGIIAWNESLTGCHGGNLKRARLTQPLIRSSSGLPVTL